MFNKIKRLIEKIKYYFSHEACYNEMEKQGIAVFGMCSGALNPEYYTEKCLYCPYFRQIKEKDNDR